MVFFISICQLMTCSLIPIDISIQVMETFNDAEVPENTNTNFFTLSVPKVCSCLDVCWWERSTSCRRGNFSHHYFLSHEEWSSRKDKVSAVERFIVLIFLPHHLSTILHLSRLFANSTPETQQAKTNLSFSSLYIFHCSDCNDELQSETTCSESVDDF